MCLVLVLGCTRGLWPRADPVAPLDASFRPASCRSSAARVVVASDELLRIVSSPHGPQVLSGDQLFDIVDGHLAPSPYPPPGSRWGFRIDEARGETYALLTEPNIFSDAWQQDVHWGRLDEDRWQRMSGMPPKLVLEWNERSLAFYSWWTPPVGEVRDLATDAPPPGLDESMFVQSVAIREGRGVIAGRCDDVACVQRVSPDRLGAIERLPIDLSCDDTEVFALASRTGAVITTPTCGLYEASYDEPGWGRIELPELPEEALLFGSALSVDGTLWLVFATREGKRLYRRVDGELRRQALPCDPLYTLSVIAEGENTYFFVYTREDQYVLLRAN